MTETIPKWETVDTAPPNQPVLLGWWEDWPDRQWKTFVGPYECTKGRWLHGQATHWMPTPEPPEDRPEGCRFCGADTVMANCRACEGER